MLCLPACPRCTVSCTRPVPRRLHNYMIFLTRLSRWNALEGWVAREGRLKETLEGRQQDYVTPLFE